MAYLRLEKVPLQTQEERSSVNFVRKCRWLSFEQLKVSCDCELLFRLPRNQHFVCSTVTCGSGPLRAGVEG